MTSNQEDIKKSLTDRFTIVLRTVIRKILWATLNIIFFPVAICALFHKRCNTPENKKFWDSATNFIGHLWLGVLVFSVFAGLIWLVTQL